MSVKSGDGASLVVHFLCDPFFGQAKKGSKSYYKKGIINNRGLLNKEIKI